MVIHLDYSSHFRLRSRTPKKPKSKKAPPEGGAAAGPSKTAAKEEGTKDHPISLLDDKAGKRRKSYIVIEENGKKKKVVDIVRLVDPTNQCPCTHYQQRDFHPDLQSAIEDLKVAITKGSYLSRSSCTILISSQNRGM